MKKTWIVVADSAHARLFTAETPTSGLTELEDLVHLQARMHDQDLTTDGPGRHSNDTGVGAHGYEPKVTPSEEEAIRFAKELAKELYQAFHAHKFEQLIIVAAPRFLGHLRNALDKNVARVVSLEVAKDLVNEKPEEIRKHLPEYLPQL
ncbi:host attachment protein [Sulfurivirga sp.]|uniref:host attachment protein n=1 Tax=Sulfurivirga sp. TaxID=2614236 RepID=UPI0026012CB6|nr:host attachment protein [Sulfurivirga sp.]